MNKTSFLFALIGNIILFVPFLFILPLAAQGFSFYAILFIGIFSLCCFAVFKIYAGSRGWSFFLFGLGIILLLILFTSEDHSPSMDLFEFYYVLALAGPAVMFIGSYVAVCIEERRKFN